MKEKTKDIIAIVVVFGLTFTLAYLVVGGI